TRAHPGLHIMRDKRSYQNAPVAKRGVVDAVFAPAENIADKLPMGQVLVRAFLFFIHVFHIILAETCSLT
ncbi:hypothetical protein PENTCL1PPCAC_19243, partial [Pristionchus entomophagus]